MSASETVREEALRRVIACFERWTARPDDELLREELERALGNLRSALARTPYRGRREVKDAGDACLTAADGRRRPVHT